MHFARWLAPPSTGWRTLSRHSDKGVNPLRPKFLALAATLPLLTLAALVIAIVQPLAGAQRAVTEAQMPALPMPQIRLELQRGLVVLSGVVPDVAERDTMWRRAVSVYGLDRVVDKIRIESVANPAWLSPAFLPDLRGLADAVAVLEDASLVVDGVADSARARDSIVARLGDFANHHMRVINRISLREGISAP
jgi:hypothetical protein